VVLILLPVAATAAPGVPYRPRPALLPVLVHLRFPALLNLGFLGGLLYSRFYLGVDALPGSQHLALQVEAAALLGVVGVEQLLEARHDVLGVGLATLGGLDVQDLAGLLEGHAAVDACAGGGGVGVELGLGARVVGRRLRLLVGFAECAADHAGADDHDLGYEAVRLRGKMSASAESGFMEAAGQLGSQLTCERGWMGMQLEPPVPRESWTHDT
jgi:hypothetical protein